MRTCARAHVGASTSPTAVTASDHAAEDTRVTGREQPGESRAVCLLEALGTARDAYTRDSDPEPLRYALALLATPELARKAEQERATRLYDCFSDR